MDLLRCETRDELVQRVREWSSALSDEDHLIRSTILDIHLNVEHRLKVILYQALHPLVFHGDDEGEYETHRSALLKTVHRLNFGTVLRILRPCFKAFPADELADLGLINEVRNQTAHRNADNASYEGRNPFRDADCLAQLFFDAWAGNQALANFCQTMIGDPRARAKRYEELYCESLRQETSQETRHVG